MSIAICLLMITSVSASITQNAGQPQNINQSNPSPTSGGSGGLADSPWPMFRQNLNHTGLSPYDTSANPGKLKWAFTTGGIIFSSPAIGFGGTIYIGSNDHKLHAINPNGTEKWNFTTAGDVFSSPSIGTDGTIYVGSGEHKLYAINPDGTEKWNFTARGSVVSSPAITPDGTIYVGSDHSKLYAINPDGTEKWCFTTIGSVMSSPAISSDGTIYVGSSHPGDKLYAINLDGTEKWNFTTAGDVFSSPSIGTDGTIYVGSLDNKLYAINPDGTEKWNFATGSNIESSPAIGSDGTIYIGSRDNRLYAINPNGSMKWSFKTGDFIYFSSPAIGSEGTIYIGSQDRKLYAINPDGTQKWSFATGNAVFSPAIGSDGTIYVGSYDHKLYAIGSLPTNLKVAVTSHFSELNTAAQSSITVHVTDGINPVQGATVNLDSDNGGIFSPQSGITDTNGDFKSIFNAPTVTSQIICRISAEASKTGYNDGSGYVDVTINPIPWPMFGHNLNHTGISPYDTSSNPGLLKWSFTTGDGVKSSPVIGSDETIYIGSEDHKLYAINSNGSEKWNFTTESEIYSSPAIDSDGTIYISSFYGKLYSINPDGTEKWNYTTVLGLKESSPAIGSDGTVYIGNYEDNKLYAINPDGTLKWTFITGTNYGIRSSPAIDIDGTIYVGSGNGKLYAVNPDGSEKWSLQVGNRVASSPAIGPDGTIYVGSMGIPDFHAINPDGTVKWSFYTGSTLKPERIISTPSFGSDGTIYIGSYPWVFALNPDGSEKWRFTTGNTADSSPAIGSDGTIFIGSENHNVYAINPDGTEKWMFPTGNWIFSSPAIGTDGTIYIGSHDNKLYAIGELAPNIIVEKTANVTVAKPGDLIKYTIYYNNTGPDEAQTVWINDTLPEGVTFITSSAEANRTGDYNWTFYNVGPSVGSPNWNDPYTPSPNPSGRHGHDMAYDIANQKVVMFGGRDPSYSDETWEYDPATRTWSGPYMPSPRPYPCIDHAMAYDSANNRIVLFGGYDGLNRYDETWEYDTASHTWFGPYLPTPRPSARYKHQMDYDSVNNRIVFFGGFDGKNDGETWEYDTLSHQWYGPYLTLPHPIARVNHDLVYDSVNNRIVLFGGWRSGFDDETWEYETSTHTWHGPYMPTPRPSNRISHAMAYDSAYDRAVLFGGFNGVDNDETWEYDTSSHIWAGPISLSKRPSAREIHAMAFDSINDKVILFSGWDGAYDNETWEYTRTNMPSTNYFTVTVQVNANVPNGTILTNYAHLEYTDSLGNLMLDSLDSADVVVLAPENKPPIANASTDQTINEGDAVQFDASSSHDPDGTIISYEWDFDVSDGLWWETGATPDATGPTPTHVYGDDGVFITTLRVTDNDNLSAIDTCNVTVQNVDPTVTIESLTMEVEIGLRVAGRKYNNVSMALYEEGNQIGYVSIERMPGSPTEQMAWIPVSINFSKSYNATVTYTPENPPNVGGNPVWIYIKSQNGSIKKIHHTFNVQQSKKRDSEHWNHVEPWEVDLSAHFIGLPFEIISHIIDPGSDDEILTYTYGSQVKTVTYLNNPPNPDPYPSPEVNPVDITDTITLVYEGPGTVRLAVMDDDGGITSENQVIS